MKLEKLTPEQEQLMYEVRDEWMDFLFSCKNKLDKEKATIGINNLYSLSGLKQPEIIFLSSPLALQYAANILLNGNRTSVMDSVWDSVHSSVQNYVWSSVWDEVYNLVRDEVRDSLWDYILASVPDYVWDYAWNEVYNYVQDYVHNYVQDSVRSTIWNKVKNHKLNYFSFTPYGNLSSFKWVAFFDFFERIGIFKNQHFTDFKNLLKSGIYDMIVLDNLCLACELPVYISRDNRGKLHNEKKYCIEWNDGFKIWKWKGADVPQKLIETPELITKEDLKNNQNTEVRRAFIEKLGVSKYFDILSGGKGLELIDQDTDDQGYPMRLMQFEFGEGNIQEKIQVLEVTCPSTKRVYNLYPPNQKSKNIWEAKASTFNNEKLTYRHGDVGLVKEKSNNNKPLIET